MQKNTDSLSWQVLSSAPLLDCGIFSVLRNESINAEQKKGTFYTVSAPDWITVIPEVTVNNRDCFLMVKQYRHGAGRITYEFPAGALNAGEKPQDAAQRELKEETGYAAQSFTKIGECNPNPAFMQNRIYTYIAKNAFLQTSQNLDEHELISFELVPVEEVQERMGNAPYDHAMMLVALFQYNRWNKGADRIRTGA